jgi:hypothetical protein
MLFTSKETVEDIIVRLLSRGKTTPLKLHEAIVLYGENVTVQAVYKALRYLIQDTVVVKSGKYVEISQEWVNKVSSTFNTQNTLPQLADGEAAIYNYKSLVNLDAYWKHLMSALDDKFSQYPVFLYSPYHIWYHISERAQSESDYFESFAKEHQYAFLVIGNETALDKKFKNEYQNDFLQIDTWRSSQWKETDNLTIINDYIINTILDKKLVEAIKKYYSSALSGEQATVELNKVLSAPNISKIKIERNAKKARMLRKKLFKNFYLPKEVKEKYDLF